MERRPAVGSKCGVGILHVCQVKKTITKNVPTIILTVHLRIWLIISRKLSLCGLFWTTLYIYLHTYTCISNKQPAYVLMYIVCVYLCVCRGVACVCVCVRLCILV